METEQFRRRPWRSSAPGRQGRRAPKSPRATASARGWRRPRAAATRDRDRSAVRVERRGGALRPPRCNRLIRAGRSGRRAGRARELQGRAELRLSDPSRRRGRSWRRPSRRASSDNLERACQDCPRRREERPRRMVRSPVKRWPAGCWTGGARLSACRRDRCARAPRTRAGAPSRSQRPRKRAWVSSHGRRCKRTREPSERPTASGQPPHQTISCGTVPNDPAPGMTAAASVWNHCSKSALYIAR